MAKVCTDYVKKEGVTAGTALAANSDCRTLDTTCSILADNSTC